MRSLKMHGSTVGKPEALARKASARGLASASGSLRCAHREIIRNGFSLLEVLLALALGVVLLSAIGVAVDQSWRLSTQGQTELTRQQVARAVFRMIERDVRSVMFVPPSEFADDEAATTGGSASTSSTSNTDSTNSSNKSNATKQVNNAAANSEANTGATAEESATTMMTATGQDALVLASRGIRGDQWTLEIDGSRPQRPLAFEAAAEGDQAAFAFSDLRTVQYLVAPAGATVDVLARGGLSRREADRYAVLSAEATGTESSGQFQTSLLAAEIAAIEFRYFDGTTWQPMWDSQSYGRLPRAIEVQIRFTPPDAGRGVWLNSAVNRSTETARIVIMVPAADPLPEEMLP